MSALTTQQNTTWQPSTEVDLTARQLDAVAAFHRARHAAEAAAGAASRSREMRMDASRRLEVLLREHEALVARSHQQLLASAGLLRTTARRRAVLAHRNAWFASKVSQALQDHGISIVATLDNGADVVGLAIAEQPDLVLVEDTLAMVPGEQVVRSVREFCPGTLVAAQVAYGDRVGALLEAGATPVFTRQVPPADVAVRLRELVNC